MSRGTRHDLTADGYIDIRRIHPDFAKAACKYCDVESFAYRNAVEDHGHTFCADHDPLADTNLRGERVTVASTFDGGDKSDA